MASKLGEVFVQISTKGMDKAKLALSGIQENFKKLNDSINKVGSLAGGVFSRMRSDILSFVGAASPRVIAEYTAAWTILSRTVGTIFIPLIRQVSNYMLRLAVYFSNLTSEERDNYLWWTKLALGITGVLMLLPQLISLGKLVVGVFQLMFTVATSPLLLGLTAIAAIIAGVLLTMKSIDGIAQRIQASADRIRGGKVKENEYKGTKAYEEVMAESDPEKRKEIAKKWIEEYKKAVPQQLNQINKQYSGGVWDIGVGGWNLGNASRGMESFKQMVGMKNMIDRDESNMKEATDRVAMGERLLHDLEHGTQPEYSDYYGVKGPTKAAKAEHDEAERKKQQAMEASLGFGSMGFGGQAPRLTGISDAWRNLQQAQVESPTERIWREMGLNMKHLVTLQEQNNKQQLMPVNVKGGL